jgi:hypothetical protein
MSDLTTTVLGFDDITVLTLLAWNKWGTLGLLTLN